jgi:hypothetical protein
MAFSLKKDDMLPFNRALIKGLTNNFDEILANIPLSIRESPEFNSIKSLALGETERQLTEQESIELAKPILKILGQDSDFLPLLEQAWETWQPNNTLGSTSAKILSGALAASMIIVAASAEVKGNIGGVEFHKHNVPIPEVTALFGQVGKIILGSR